MKKRFLLYFIFLSVGLSAQWGIKTSVLLPQNRIAESTSQKRFFTYTAGGGVDYWFRLKKYRLEFLPAIHFHTSTETIDFNTTLEGKLHWNVIDFAPVLQFYPLDFANDCKCPTFSKQSNFFKKGLFVQVAPGIALSNLRSKNIDTNQGSGENANLNEWLAFARVGLGVDIGISDLITLSPIIGYQSAQTLDWSSVFTSTTSKNLNLFSGLVPQIRIGFRFDRKNY